MGVWEDFRDWVKDNRLIAGVIAAIFILVIAQTPNLFRSQVAVWGDTDLPIRATKVVSSKTTYNAGEPAYIDVTWKNFDTVRHTAKTEVLIIADYLAADWGLPLVVVTSMPIESCGGEDFVQAKQITLSGGQTSTVQYRVTAPAPTTTTKAGDLNWDDSHTIVVGIYDECFAGYFWASTHDVTIRGEIDPGCQPSCSYSDVCDELAPDGCGGTCSRDTDGIACGLNGVCSGGLCDEGEGNGGTPTDTDGDGISNAIDNCPTISNPDQLNTYGDDRGDACESKGKTFFETLEDIWTDYKATILAILGIGIVAIVVIVIISQVAKRRR